MSFRIGINGLGRIGKLVFRLLLEQDNIEVVAVNDTMPANIMSHLLKYDTVHGRLTRDLEVHEDVILYNQKRIAVMHHSSPELIPWSNYNVDCVIEASGQFKTRESLSLHLKSGARKVLLCQPAVDLMDQTLVIGVNDELLTKDNVIISNASCTTNCIAPILKVIDDALGLEKAFFNTVHPFTNNQSLLDGPHNDPRRSRAAMGNIIPTTSTAVEALKLVMPHLSGRVDGFATRVPVAAGAYVEFVMQVNQKTSVSEFNTLFKNAANTQYQNIISYSTEPIVSSDIIGNPYSAIFDAPLTKVVGTDFVQAVAWYDNETGYANRIVDLIQKIYQLNA